MEEIYPYTLGFVWLLCPLVLVALIFIRAPYGRYYHKGWGYDLKAKTGWLIMESPSLFFFSWIYLKGMYSEELIPFLLALCWAAHYSYRTLFYPIYFVSPIGKMPLSVASSAFIFNLFNSFNNGYALSHSEAPPFGWNTVLGFGLFVVGMATHIRADMILREVKHKTRRYKVINRFLYRYICSPNYFGEIIQWTGFAVAAWNPAAASFALFTFCNLMPRSLAHLRWYRQTFDHFPRERRALIPFLF